MFVTPAGQVVFQNFLKHVTSHHVGYLFQCDRPLQVTGSQTSMERFFPVGAASEAPNARAVVSTPQSQDRFEASQVSRLREKLLQATVRVIAHGPYPIAMLQNPAMEEYLVELGVVPENFKFPCRQTVTKRLDAFLDEECASQDSYVREILPSFGGAWDEWI